MKQEANMASTRSTGLRGNKLENYHIKALGFVVLEKKNY